MDMYCLFHSRYALTGHRSPVTKVLFHPVYRLVNINNKNSYSAGQKQAHIQEEVVYL